jgi:probable F420-dependent oxidoreductase
MPHSAVMHLALAIFATDESIAPGELARWAEELGFESLLFPEHTHIPASRETPYPGGGDLPREYIRQLDPFVACTDAAAATTWLKVGTGVCLIPQHEPIALAKATASIDFLSGGRFLFGVGGGWNVDEMRNHGADPDHRFRLMRERVEAVKEIWTQDEASYHGRYVDFERIWSWPKPVRRPHPPILVGGNGPRVLDRVLRYGDAWMPNRITDDESLLARVEELRSRAERPIGVTISGASTKPDRLARYAEAGIERAVFWVPPGERAEIEPRIEQILAGAEKAGVRPGGP